MTKEVISLTTGLPGAGKTYARGVCFVLEFLRDEPGVYYSNLPLKVERFVEHFGAEKEDEIRSRIQFIPEEVEATWRDGSSGPWEYFGETDLRNAWIALDEAHTMCGAKHPKPHKRLWQEFCGELRHRGCQLELITQSQKKLAQEVSVDIAVWREIISGETVPDDVFRIPWGDWWQLKAAYVGKYVGTVVQETSRQGAQAKWKTIERRVWDLQPDLFGYYDSFAAPKGGGIAGKKVEPWERLNRVAILWWFWRRHWHHLLFKNPFVPPIACFFVAMVVATHTSSAKEESARTDVAEVKNEVIEKVSIEPAEPVAPRIVAITQEAAIYENGETIKLGDDTSEGPILAFSPSDGVVICARGRLRLSTEAAKDRRELRSTVPDRESGALRSTEAGRERTGDIRSARSSPRSAAAAAQSRDWSGGGDEQPGSRSVSVSNGRPGRN